MEEIARGNRGRTSQERVSREESAGGNHNREEIARRKLQEGFAGGTCRRDKREGSAGGNRGRKLRERNTGGNCKREAREDIARGKREEEFERGKRGCR